MRTRRVALIFDNEARPETTGTYCLRALKGLCEVEHFLPRDLEDIPRHGFDLYLNVDDGLRSEMQVIVEEAHKANRKVAAHATTAEGIRNAVLAGVDSIEHGHHADRADLELMKLKGVYLVPTLSGLDAHIARKPDDFASAKAQAHLEAIRQVLSISRQIGVKIADGSDPATAERHGKNAEELQSMNRRGLTTLEAIRAATTSAADLVGWPDDVGAIEAGKFADLIAVQGDPLEDIALLQHIKFVMKGGTVIKNDLIGAH